MRTFTAREFNQDTGRAKHEARRHPVVVTDHGRPDVVLLSWDEYQRLRGDTRSLAEALASPAAAAVEFEPPRDRTVAGPVELG